MSFFSDIGDFFSDAGQAIVGAAAIVVGAVTGQPWLIGIGVSLEIGFITGKLQDKGSQQVGGSADQVSYDPTEGDKLAVGYADSMGSFVDEFSHDRLPWGGGNEGKNRVKERILDLFDFHCDSLVEVWNGTTKLTLGSPATDSTGAPLGYPVQEYISNGHCRLYIRFYNGDWTQTADPHLIAVSDGRWTLTDQGVGRCYVRLTYVAAQDNNDQVWSGGEPTLKFVVKGARLYNPAKDSTVGGSGAHRWGDYSTYEWSDNEPLIRYNVCRGFYLGNGQLFYGIGCTHDEVRFDDAVAAIAIADEDVAVKATGGTQKRYRAGGTIEVATAPRDVLKALADASGGRNVTVAGQYRLFVGAFYTPARAFVDTDVMPAADLEDDPKNPGDSLINTIYGSYLEKSEGWVTKSLPKRRSTDDITEDGAVGERSLTLSTGFLQDFYQGQRVMEIMRRRARSQISAVRTFLPIFYEVEPGDILDCELTRPAWSGYVFYVRNSGVDDKVNVTLSLQQDGEFIYEWDADTDELPITGGDLPSGDPPVPLTAVVTTATPYEIQGGDGTGAATLKLLFEDPLVATARGLEVEYRVHGTNASQFAMTNNLTDGLINLPHLIPRAEYDYRYRIIAGPGIVTPWSDWFTFTAPDVRIDVAALSDAIQGDLAQVATNTADIASLKAADTAINKANAASDAALRSLRDDVSRAESALLGIQIVLPQMQDHYQRQLVAFVQGLTGSDVVDFSARLIDVESAVIDLEAGKADTSALQALDAQINTPAVGLAALVSTLAETVALLDPSSATATLKETVVAVRGQGVDLADMGSTLLGVLQGLENLKADQSATLAYIRREMTAQVTQGVSANADAIGQVGVLMKSGLDTLTASVTSEQKARVDADGAMASNITIIQAALSGLLGNNAVQAAITAEQNARVSAVQAVADSVTTLAAYFGSGIDGSHTVKSLVDSEASARSSADAAAATRIDGVEAAFGDLNAGGYFSVEAQAAPSGASARVALLVSATSGGTPHTAAFLMDALTAGGTRIILLSDAIYLSNGSDQAALSDAFQLSGGVMTVKNAAITNLTVANLQAKALSQTHVGRGTSTVLSNSAWTDLATVTFTTVGGNVNYDFAGKCTWTGAAPEVDYQILRDGSAIDNASDGGGSAVPSYITTAWMGCDVNPSAGSHTYKLQGKLVGSGSVTCISSVIRCTEQKDDK